MPHIIVKLFPGRSEAQKMALTEKIVENVIAVTGCPDRAVSVSFEEVDEKDWMEQVFEPDILNKKETLYKKPGYRSVD